MVSVTRVGWFLRADNGQGVAWGGGREVLIEVCNNCGLPVSGLPLSGVPLSISYTTTKHNVN